MRQIELFEVPSPCIGVCQSGPKGYCHGCFRSREERVNWLKVDDNTKKIINDACMRRKQAHLRRQQKSVGMQAAVIEFSRHVAGLDGATSSEFAPDAEHPVIALITEWKRADGTREVRSQDSDLGGTMRLGAEECRLTAGTKVAEIYGSDVVSERHRHRWEFNNDYLELLKEAGLVIAGRSMDGTLVEVVEVADHPWFVGCQFHPEFTSTPRDGHPLFTSFVEAAHAYSKTEAKESLFS